MKHRVAFDIDDTLWKLVEDTKPRVPGLGPNCACGTHLKQELDPEMVAILRMHVRNGDDVFVWSAGGLEYARSFVERFLPDDVGITVIEKRKGQGIDVCYDDQNVDLATINLLVKREHADHWEEPA